MVILTIIVAFLFLLLFYRPNPTRIPPETPKVPAIDYEERLRMNDFSTKIEEKFPFDNGTLVVGKYNWYIEFWRRPDLRYRTRFFKIYKDDVETYIEAFQSNWELYEKTKNDIYTGSPIETRGQKNMLIKVGGNYGLWLLFDDYFFPFVDNKAQLDKLIDNMEKAKARAEEIMTFLKKNEGAMKSTREETKVEI